MRLSDTLLRIFLNPARERAGTRHCPQGVLCALLGVYLLINGLASDSLLKPETGATKVRPAAGSNVFNAGSELAHQFCATCHLFPEPDLLDKRTWATGTLRKMAPFLGVAQIHFDGRPDGARLAASPLFPRTPWVTETQWRAIQNYFIQSAPETALPQDRRGAIAPRLEHFRAEPIVGKSKPSLTTLIRIDSARHEVMLADAATGSLSVFDPKGAWLRDLPMNGAVVGLTEDQGRTLATLIGHVFPSDVPEGKIVSLPSLDGKDQLHVVLSDLERPTHCVVADLNGDGRNDLVVCCFGNYLGRLSWFEQLAGGKYKEHLLLEKPGAIRTEVRDVNGDGKPDILVLMAQGDEGLFLFTNKGGGEFTMKVLLRFHPAFGSTYFELADMNGDGFPDVVLTNGDNGEYPSPFKRYHGVRVFLNDGTWQFKESWFFPLNGAFKAVARDFDGDGNIDLAVISFFPDYTKSPEESFVYFHNQGGMEFTAQSFPEATSGRWLVMDTGDLDGDGAIDLVLGAFPQGPPGIAIPAGLQSRWQTNGVAGLILHNTLKDRRKTP